MANNVYRCPTDTPAATTLVGCGATFRAQTDCEGHVDCPACGMWFKPRAIDLLPAKSLTSLTTEITL